MTVATTQIVITAKDSTKSAFSSVNSGLTGLSSTAIKAGAALGAIGATAALGSFIAFTKQTIDAQDELSKLSQKTGIAVESLAGLEFAAEQSGVSLNQVAKATRQFSLLVAEAGEAGSTSADKIKQLGLSYQDLKDLSPEKQLLALSDALQKFSKEDRAVALTATLGNRMADLIPLLSGGSTELSKLIEQGKKFNPVTQESARQAELFNDQINVLSKSVGTIGREFAQQLIPGLSIVANKMAQVTQESGLLAGALAGVKEIFVQAFGNPKILGDVGQIRREIFKTKDAISSLEGKKDSIFFDKNALLHEKEKLVALEADLQKAIGASRSIVDAQTVATESSKKFAIAIEETNKPLAKRASIGADLSKKQNDQFQVESEYIKLLKIQRQAQEDLLKPYQQSAQAAQDRLVGLQQEAKALELSKTSQISLEQAIELTTIARLEEKKAITKDTAAVDAIEKEILARRKIVDVIKQGETKTKDLGQTTRQTTDEVSQLWIQAGRNIQSTLANSIFNFFDDGLKGMLKNVISTVGRIASEFAALKLSQSIGLDSIFGVAGGAGGLGGGGASNALSLASLGTNAVSFARGGFGATSLLGSGISGLGSLTGSSSLSAFGTAFGGDAIGGLAAGGFTSSAASTASLGSSIGAAAGPLIALAVVDQIGRLFGGNKKLGGAENIPVLGGFLAGLFGRGPYKFRQQSLQGEAGAGGFDGDLTNVFRAKGGLLRSNGHKSITEQLSLETETLLDSTIQGFYKSASGFAKNLGLSASLVDNFTTEVQIKSEKGKQITEEAVAEMLKGIGNSLANNLLPTVETFRKAGEDSFATLSRLNSEFVSLAQAAQNLGASTQYAKDLVNALTIKDRTDLVDKAGGIDRLAQLTSVFADNFLSTEQRLAPTLEAMNEEFTRLGVSADITKDQLGKLIQSMDITNDVRLSLLELVPAFLQVKAASEEAKSALKAQAVATLSDAFSALNRSVDSERKKVTDNYNASIKSVNSRIDDITASLGRLNEISQSVKRTTETIAPISLDAAREAIRKATSALNSGSSVDSEALQGALEKVSQRDTSNFSDRNSFLRDQAKSLTLVNKLGDATIQQVDIQDQMLDAAEGTKLSLEAGFTRQISALDQILLNAKDQLDVAQGIDVSIKSLVSALAGFNRASNDAGGGFISLDGSVTARSGNPSITGNDIRGFAASHSPIEIYKEAIKRGVSSGQIEDSGIATRAQIDKFLKDNNLPSFDVGGVVPNTGLALVHKGERVINPAQNEAIVTLLQNLISVVRAGSDSNDKLYKLLRNMTNNGTALNTVAA